MFNFHTLRRHGGLIIAALVILAFIYIIRSQLMDKSTLSQSLAEAKIRLQHLEARQQTQQTDVFVLTQYLLNSSDSSSSQNNLTNIMEMLSPETKKILGNSTLSPNKSGLLSTYRFLPHLPDNPAPIRPAFLLSKERTGVSIVLGIPTVKRAKQNYLMNTLESLISNMNEGERNDTLIVVFVAETDLEHVHEIAKEIELTFSEHCDSGLIEVISPPASYYPDMEKLRITLNDPLDRVKWRSKENLDYAFLMAYCQFKATFFVQLEDDILTKPGFMSTMKQFAEDKTALSPWIVADFSESGSYGKLFKSSDIPLLVTFFQIFFNELPADWLLEELVRLQACVMGRVEPVNCASKVEKSWLHYKPSLFLHVGKTSSLNGKIQNFKDLSFGNVPNFYPHTNNSNASVSTQITPYLDYTLEKAYNGVSFFRGLTPHAGDHLKFTFNQPTVIKEFRFRSGSPENPSDKFYNTTVEVLPDQLDDASIWPQEYNKTIDGYLVVGNFNQFGLAEGHLDTRIGKLRELRLQVHSDSDNNVILSEIFLLV